MRPSKGQQQWWKGGSSTIASGPGPLRITESQVRDIAWAVDLTIRTLEAGHPTREEAEKAADLTLAWSKASIILDNYARWEKLQ